MTGLSFLSLYFLMPLLVLLILKSPKTYQYRDSLKSILNLTIHTSQLFQDRTPI